MVSCMELDFIRISLSTWYVVKTRPRRAGFIFLYCTCADQLGAMLVMTPRLGGKKC